MNLRTEGRAFMKPSTVSPLQTIRSGGMECLKRTVALMLRRRVGR